MNNFFRCITLLSLICLLIPQLSNAQKSYAPLGATWNYQRVSLECEGHVKYVVGSEKQVDGKDCSVIYSYYKARIPDEYSFTGDSLVVWEDNSRIYFLEGNDFYLMYDFNMEIGDTMTYYDPVNKGYFSAGNNISPTGAPAELRLIIDDIVDVELESGNQKKLFQVKDEVEIGDISDAECIRIHAFIEDVGSIGSSLTGGQCQFIGDGCVGGLQCYSSSAGEFISSYDFVFPNPECVSPTKAFAPIGAVWNYEGWSEFCEGNHMQFRVEEESVILGKDCSVIVGHGDSLVVYEEDRKVYFLEDTMFYLLYDFNLKVGDTLSHYFPVNRGVFSSYLISEDNSDPILLKSLITEVGEIQLSGMVRKFLNIEPIIDNDLENYSLLMTLIEGIGSTSETFAGELCCTVADGCFGSLQCYSDSDIEYIVISPEVPHPECSFPDSVDELDEFAEVVLYPNPADYDIYLEEIEGEFKVSLYDMSLKLIAEHENEYAIPIYHMQEGAYILKLESRAAFKYFKVIKR